MMDCDVRRIAHDGDSRDALTGEHKIRIFDINVGQQHLAVYGVPHRLSQFGGKILERHDSQIGLLQRGKGKLKEGWTHLHTLPCFGRRDDVASIAMARA